MEKELGIYLGKEIEGADLGVRTLFIPRGCVASLGVSKVYDKIQQLECLRIYFGAKEQRGLDIDDLALIELLLKEKRHGKKYQILAEVTDFEFASYTSTLLLRCIEFIYVVKINAPQYSVPLKHIKFEDAFDVSWYKCDSPFITNLNDPEYGKDVKITI